MWMKTEGTVDQLCLHLCTHSCLLAPASPTEAGSHVASPNLMPQELLLFSSRDLCWEESQWFCGSFSSSRVAGSPCWSVWPGSVTPWDTLPPALPAGILLVSWQLSEAGLAAAAPGCIPWALPSARKAQIPVHPLLHHPVQPKGRFWCEKPQTSKMHLAKILSSPQEKNKTNPQMAHPL